MKTIGNANFANNIFLFSVCLLLITVHMLSYFCLRKYLLTLKNSLYDVLDVDLSKNLRCGVPLEPSNHLNRIRKTNSWLNCSLRSHDHGNKLLV